MPMKGLMDPLAADLASGKIKIVEAEKKPEKPAIVPEKNRLALLMKKHDDQCKVQGRAAQEAQALQKYHRERGEHELANIHKELVVPLQKAASLHKKLSGVYSKRHGTETK
jgi:hypothetical protein